MNEQIPDSGQLVWAALRQIQALRDSLIWALGGGAILAKSTEELNRWMTDQGLPTQVNALDVAALPAIISTAPKHEGVASQARPLISILYGAFDQLRRSIMADRFIESETQARLISHSNIDDFGTDRSGAGWSRTANFCVTSAFVRLLGAHEQFELDVLKTLFFYRPTGELLGNEADNDFQIADTSIAIEEPEPDPKDRNKLLFKKPPTWTWIRPLAENNSERKKIFSRVFSIDTALGTGQERTKNNEARDSWYEKRNAIAHGRQAVEMTLGQYAEVEAFLYRCVTHLATECRTKFKVIV